MDVGYGRTFLEHRVREVTSGEGFSVTLFTPSHLDTPTERELGES